MKTWKLVVVLLLFGLLLINVSSATDGCGDCGCDGSAGYMHLTPEQMAEMQHDYDTAVHITAADLPSLPPDDAPTSHDNLPFITYVPGDRNQGSCGNCWVFASTAAMEMAHHVTYGINDRLSVQWFNSRYNNGGPGGFACCGGWPAQFASFYNTAGLQFAVPWAPNTNANFQDGIRCCHNADPSNLCLPPNDSTAVPFATITTTPNYALTNVQQQTITTMGSTTQAQAIANIKAVVDNNEAVIFSFYLPVWSTFSNWWGSNNENAIFDMDQEDGVAWNSTTGGAHAVTIVGYDNSDPNPANHYWVVLNSWGTAGGLRPNGLFRIPMDMNYQTLAPGKSDSGQAFYFERLTVQFANHPPIANAGGPYNAPEGTMITFDASGSSDPDGDTLQYRWDLNGDGIFEIDWTTDATVSHTWCDEYSGTVTLEVTDGIVIIPSNDTAPVTVTNVDPVAVALVNPLIANEGQEVTFDASGSSDQGCDTLSYHWDFGVGDQFAAVPVTTFTYCELGPHTVILTVNDGDGGEDTDTVTVTVNNVPPEAYAGPDQTVDEGDTVQFDGSATGGGYCDTFTYSWDFNDGSSGSGQAPTHEYCDNGVYSVILTVTDDDGASDTDTLTVTVNNVAPVAHAGDDQTIDEGDTVSFSGTATDAGTCDTLSYSWEFGDGSPAVTGTLMPTHEYCDNGVYTVTLTVTDDDGDTGTDELIVTVNNVAPTVTKGAMEQPNPEFILPLQTLTFHGTFSDPGWCDSHTALWSFGDGQTAVGTLTEENLYPDATGTVMATHAYSAPGDYLVTVTVTDDDGGATTTGEWSVHVADVAEAKHILAGYIQSLPPSAFKGKADQRKAAFANMFDALDDMIENEEWNGFVTSIQNNVREKADGHVDGKPNDDWITDKVAQEHICMKIDDIVAYVETFM